MTRSTLVRTLDQQYENNVGYSRGHRHTFTLSNGNVMTVVSDDNNLYVYESSNRTSWTLRATIAVGGSTGLTPAFTAASFADNSLAIWWSPSYSALGQPDQITPTVTVNYVKMTYSTYAVSATQVITATYPVTSMDGTVTDTDVPILAVTTSISGPANSYEQILVRRSSDGTWVNAFGALYLGVIKGDSLTTTISALGGTNTARNMVRVVGGNAGTTATMGVISWFKINETTGIATAGSSATLNQSLGSTYGPNSTSKYRNGWIFRSGTNEVTYAQIMTTQISDGQNLTDPTVTWFRATWDGTTWTLISQGTDIHVGNVNVNNYAGMTFGTVDSNYDAVNILVSTYNNAGVAMGLANFVLRIKRADGSGILYGIGSQGASGTVVAPLAFEHPYINPVNSGQGSNYVDCIASGGDRNFALHRHDVSFNFYNPNTPLYQTRHVYSGISTYTPSAETPANGSTVNNANMPLSATVTTPAVTGGTSIPPDIPQSSLKAEWQIANDSGFTTSLLDYIQDESKWFVPASAKSASATTTDNDTLPLSFTPNQGTKYLRSAFIDLFGNRSAFIAANSFTISHPPSATPVSPGPPGGSSTTLAYSATTTFQWSFSDTATNDYQTAYEIVVEKVSDGSVVVDSGKVVSASQSGSVAIPSAQKGVQLRWKVRAWDRDDVVGAYSSTALFIVNDAPVINVTNPTNGGVVTSGVPSASFTVTTSGGTTIVSYQVSFYQAGALVWSSGLVNTGNAASGTAFTSAASQSYLKNNSAYTVLVTTTDSSGLSATTSPISITTSWVLPATPTGVSASSAQYDVEGTGYNQVMWSDSTRDANFQNWSVYRIVTPIDPTTGAATGSATVVKVADIYAPSTSGYIVQDYLAPSSSSIVYAVTQTVNRFGDRVESLQAQSAAVTTISTGYYLITAPSINNQSLVVRLYNVTDDAYTAEFEEAEYNVIGRGRHYDRGDDLGNSGSLTARIRGSQARVRKQSLENIQATGGVLYLRNPFGDVLAVHVGNLSVSRIAGVGLQEFCDVTVPYAEVGI